MIRYLTARDLARFPRLAHTMFRDRAAQFAGRLGWNVTVDANGEERDQYDRLDALYLIWETADGRHGGSMRFLPTAGGPTMINDHFRQLTGGARIEDPAVWECTRFCLAPGAAPRLSAALMLGACELGLGQGLSHAVAVFDARMVRVYRRLGWGPVILGSEGEGNGAISVGLWAFTADMHRQLAPAAAIAPELSRHWYARAFGTEPALRAV